MYGPRNRAGLLRIRCRKRPLSFDGTPAFSQPGDIVDLADLVAVTTYGYDPDVVGDSLGMVLMRVQASLPNGSEDGVNLLMYGRAGLINNVEPDSALIFNSAPLEVTVYAVG